MPYNNAPIAPPEESHRLLATPPRPRQENHLPGRRHSAMLQLRRLRHKRCHRDLPPLSHRVSLQRGQNGNHTRQTAPQYRVQGHRNGYFTDR